MFRKAAPQLIRATRPAFRNLPNGFDYIETVPADVSTSATVEQPSELLLTLTRQDEFLMAAKVVKSVSLMTANGKMGVLPGHEYVVEKLEPGMIEVEHQDGKVEKFATTGGFAHVNTDGSVDVNTAEAIPATSLELALVEKELAANQDLAKNGDEDGKIRGAIGVATLEPIAEALKAM
eukprot:TRINITY_DN4087_c0_g1_i1.p2 TRINITY_DN4087_c0_g1~~TRINITY_DN4087_c0_g1_i1.p2  ORF type:complete len:178 (+),score=94.74 TRINITY_DN4087_c0_g1_i1:65-598(+)